MKILNALFMTALLAGGASAQEQKAAAPDAWKNKTFTIEELKRYDGKDGRPVYVAVDGVVYDVSRSKYWKTGTHMKMHKAGTDLSLAIHKRAPKFIHKDGKILEKMPKVGVLAGPGAAAPSPQPEVQAADAEPAGKPRAEAPAAADGKQPAPSVPPPAAEPKAEAAAKPAEKPSLLAIHKISPAEIGKETKCPVSGDKITVSEKTLALDLKGRTYYFSGQGALEKFKASPEKYGGWLDKAKNLLKRK